MATLGSVTSSATQPTRPSLAPENCPSWRWFAPTSPGPNWALSENDSANEGKKKTHTHTHTKEVGHDDAFKHSSCNVFWVQSRRKRGKGKNIYELQKKKPMINMCCCADLTTSVGTLPRSAIMADSDRQSVRWGPRGQVRLLRRSARIHSN